MTMTDFAFSMVRQWMIGTSPAQPSGMLVGTGSSATGFDDIRLDSGLDPTRHHFESRSGIGFVAQFEHLVDSGDIITGSLVHEIGMIDTSGGQVWFRELLPEIELLGSTQIDNFLQLNIK